MIWKVSNPENGGCINGWKYLMDILIKRYIYLNDLLQKSSHINSTK